MPQTSVVFPFIVRFCLWSLALFTTARGRPTGGRPGRERHPFSFSLV